MGRGWMGWVMVLGLAGNSLAGAPVDYARGAPAEAATRAEALAPVVPVALAMACTATVAQHADAGALHAADCSPLAFTTNPPSSGRHYGNWAAYKTYAALVPPGFLVHSLEHGAVVVGYNCPMGCEEDVAVVQAWIDNLGPDVSPCQGMKRKVILAPNPDLDMRWGAAAWSWTWKASCPDTASLGDFFRAHYNQTVEAGVCGGGLDPGGTGWCPSAVEDRRGPPPRARERWSWRSMRFAGCDAAGRRMAPEKD